MGLRQRSNYPVKAELCTLDKTPEDTYTKAEKNELPRRKGGQP